MKLNEVNASTSSNTPQYQQPEEQISWERQNFAILDLIAEGSRKSGSFIQSFYIEAVSLNTKCRSNNLTLFPSGLDIVWTCWTQIPLSDGQKGEGFSSD